NPLSPDADFDLPQFPDIHNISMGFWDPVKAATSPSIAPGLGGNVPYTLARTPISWRLPLYAPPVCYISVPDYAKGTNISWERYQASGTSGQHRRCQQATVRRHAPPRMPAGSSVDA